MIALVSDHAGFELKQTIRRYLDECGHTDSGIDTQASSQKFYIYACRNDLRNHDN